MNSTSTPHFIPESDIKQLWNVYGVKGLEKFRLSEIKQELRSNNLLLAGNKKQAIERLHQHYLKIEKRRAEEKEKKQKQLVPSTVQDTSGTLTWNNDVFQNLEYLSFDDVIDFTALFDNEKEVQILLAHDIQNEYSLDTQSYLKKRKWEVTDLWDEFEDQKRIKL